MINMATNYDEAKKFITNVSVTEDGKQFELTFGDGHVEYSDCVNDHNYNLYLYRLEKQFLEYKEKFDKMISRKYLQVINERFIGTLSTIIVLYFSCTMDVHVVIKVILSLLIAFTGLCFRINCNLKFIQLDKVKEHVELMDYLQKHMSQYYGKIINEETGEIKESQIINFNNIESFRSIDGMNNMYNLLNYNEESEPVMKKG